MMSEKSSTPWTPSASIFIPPGVEIDLRVTGIELADHLRWLVPGRDRQVEVQNGCRNVRGTATQDAVLRSCLEARRFRDRAVQSAASWAWNAKTTLSRKVFGMITR